VVWSTAASGVCVPTKPLEGVVEFGAKARLRPVRTPHGVEAQVSETRLHLQVKFAENRRPRKLISPPGSILFVADGDAFQRYGDDPGFHGVLGQEKPLRRHKGCELHLAGQVSYEEVIQPREVPIARTTSPLKASGLRRLWVLSGDVYTFPPMPFL